jgi:hypothetical protein
MSKDTAVAALAAALGSDKVNPDAVDRVLGGYQTQVNGRYYKYQTVGDLAGKVTTSGEPDADGGVSPVVVGA